jgi:type IV pilus assembly protein PilN
MTNNIKINLLPWREELREEKKKEFLNITVGILVLAIAIIGGVDRFYNSSIDLQSSRNAFLQKEISILEERIEEINLLQQKRNELLSRMKVIQELQGNRPIIVRVFDELARQLAPRVFFTNVQMGAAGLQITGVAESNNRISNQLRNFTESEWFDRPNVTAIRADSKHGPQASQFELTVVQSTPNNEEDE